MPELPEVETIRLGLLKTIINQKIKSIEILLSKMFIGEISNILSASVSNISRRGKMLILELQKNNETYHLLIHLKMTGQLIFESSMKMSFGGGHPVPHFHTQLPNKSTKVIISFESGDVLYFNDQRTFGYMKLVQSEELIQNSFLRTVGIEPLSPEFTQEKFVVLLKKRPRSNIKAFLLDQTQVAGIGNIYADESLFRSGILPWRIISSLSTDEIQLLHRSIIEVLQAGIELQGASRTHYVNVEGTRGTFLEQAAVYNRTGLPCPTCGQPIIKTKWAGRGTHYCTNCQK